MAGIGFSLKRMMAKGTYFSALQAYLFSTFISSGPWILSILTLFCLSAFAPHTLDLFELVYFRALTVYIFTFSLIGIGVFQYPLTRYLADRLYIGEKDAMVPVLNTSTAGVMIFQLATAVIFAGPAGEDFQVFVLSVLTYFVITLIWLVMVFLTALKDYLTIGIAYAAGAVVTVAASLYLGEHYGLKGYLGGYLAGHLVIVAVWCVRIFVEFPSNRAFDPDFWDFFLRHRLLIITGFFYALGLWADKIVFWLSPHAISIMPGLRVFPTYESSVFAAYLTIIPALTMFLVQVETGFYPHYKRFYMAISAKASLGVLRRLKEAMLAGLREQMSLVVRYQGILSLIVILLAPQISGLIGIKGVQVLIFRMAVLGAYLHSLLLIILLIILYFDFQKMAAAVSVLFFAANAVLTYYASKSPAPYFAAGYTLASFISLALAYYWLGAKLKKLEFITFSGQPMAVHRQEEVI
ncbi:MAG: hypothetical protein A2Z83_01430 [Omnitrophica bacterium GWA2_52_8]|nr:MAG: hypothetical protein A2Z83_01430 [Omnitrophica bacterium GWA2_52_8]